jgi:hypothetical protein
MHRGEIMDDIDPLIGLLIIIATPLVILGVLIYFGRLRTSDSRLPKGMKYVTLHDVCEMGGSYSYTHTLDDGDVTIRYKGYEKNFIFQRDLKNDGAKSEKEYNDSINYRINEITKWKNEIDHPPRYLDNHWYRGEWHKDDVSSWRKSGAYYYNREVYANDDIKRCYQKIKREGCIPENCGHIERCKRINKGD